MIPVSESPRRGDLKRGKVSFETAAKGRKQIDVSELSRVSGQLHTDAPVKENHQNPSMNGNDTSQNPSVNGNDSERVVALLENQVADLKAQLADATTEKQQL